jgi:dolichol-phosphate mannosyltransferase
VTQKSLISIIVPVYNEEENVHRLYQAVNAVMGQVQTRYDWEFIFTDNHSEDSTFEILAKIAESDPRVCAYRFSRNFGFQQSIYTGYLLAQGAAAVQIDCDLQDPPEVILDFLREWEAGFKVVYGIRRKREENLLIASARKTFYRFIDKISDRSLPHDAGDFRLIDRRIIDELAKHHNRRPYLRGIIANVGFRQAGVVYDRVSRSYGDSKFTLPRLIDLAVDGIVSNSLLPLRLAIYSGLIIALLAIIGAVTIIFYRIFVNSNWPAGFAFIAVTILFSLAVNLFVLGILGEYVGHTYGQVVERPLTIIDKIIDPRSNATEWVSRLEPTISTSRHVS